MPLRASLTAEPGTRRPPPPDSRSSSPAPGLRVGAATWTRRSIFILFGAQLVGLLVFSTVEYQSFALGRDFAAHAQAWLAIAHGHLNPFSSLYGSPFWKGNSEFLTWPLALLYFLYPHSIDLLWVQDAAVVATGVITVRWLSEVLERHAVQIGPKTAGRVLVASAVALVLNPWCYETIAFDYHSQALTALFSILALRSLWSGRHRQLLWWIPLTLLSAGLGGASVLAIGASGLLAGRSTRSIGALLVAVGSAWTLLLGHFGAIAGNGNVANWYGYLTGPARHVGPLQILIGMFQHPAAALHVVASRWELVFLFLSTVGLVGVVWPWALPTALVVILPSALNADPYFLQARAAFQTWPAIPVVLVGSISVLVWLTARRPRAKKSARLIVAGWAAALVPLSAAGIADLPGHWLAVDAQAAADLRRIIDSVPPHVEIVASQGTIGRLTITGELYDFWKLPQTFPINRRELIFVFTPNEGASPTSARDTRRAMAFVSEQLHARRIFSGGRVFEFAWRAPVGAPRLTIA